MRLGEKQELFMSLLPGLINKAIEVGKEEGFTVRGGDLFRDPRIHGKFGVKKGYGAAKSVHKLKLAKDLNFIDSKTHKLIHRTSRHKTVGKWWVKQHKYCRWGGNFKRHDGNHYSLTHYGVS